MASQNPASKKPAYIKYFESDVKLDARDELASSNVPNNLQISQNLEIVDHSPPVVSLSSFSPSTTHDMDATASYLSQLHFAPNSQSSASLAYAQSQPGNSRSLSVDTWTRIEHKNANNKSGAKDKGMRFDPHDQMLH
jgi:hypothetical protein